MPPDFDGIPVEIKGVPNWVLWKLEERNGKKTKIPYQINGQRADTTNPDTWTSYEIVKQVYFHSNGRFSGVGFVLSEDTGIVGIDWDEVKNGTWDQEILAEIKSCGSYAELSQSGTGAHVLIKGMIPGDRKRNGNIEMYSKDRFFVVTGQHIEGTPLDIAENQDAINKLYHKRFGKHQNILPKLKKSDKFNKLFSGDTAGYSSDSEADLALCSIIARQTRDKDIIDNILRASGLYREKWERADYRMQTINTALQSVERRKSADDKPESIHIPFNVVADRILDKYHIFTMRDNKQIYLYQDGVYQNEGVEAILDTKIRDEYNDCYEMYWYSINPGFPLTHIQQATMKYVSEVLAYIRAYTHITRESLDDPEAKYLNFKNCLFNLETLEIEEHRPEVKTTCRIPVNYDPQADCPQIRKFVTEVAKPEDIAFLEEWVGYCLTTDVKYQKALLLYGIPGCGKSIFALLLETFVGKDNSSAESLQKIEEDRYRSANLYGKRVNICSDIPSTRLHKTEIFKRLVSGLDTVDAEKKYQSSFNFKNKAKLTFSANKLPEGPKDPAFYERFCLIEFPNKFRGTEKEDKKLIGKLTTEAELSGFLNIALNGLRRLYDNDKFSYTKSFEETEYEYLVNSNPVAVFMDERTVISQSDIESTLLYLAYVDWCFTNKKEHVSNIEFSRQLGKIGYTSHRENVPGTNCTKKITYWDNLKLKIGQDLEDVGQDQKSTSCPTENCPPMLENCSETPIGQDLFTNQSIYENEKLSLSPVCEREGEEENRNVKEVSKKILSYSFSDNGSLEIRQNDPVLDPVLLDTLELYKKDLINFAHTEYNFVVDSMSVLVEKFNAKYPGFKLALGEQTMLNTANILQKRGWRN